MRQPRAPHPPALRSSARWCACCAKPIPARNLRVTCAPKLGPSTCTPPGESHPMTSKGGKCCAGTSCAPRWPRAFGPRAAAPPRGRERDRRVQAPSVSLAWSDGTRSIGLAPHALLSRMAALVPPPRRHVTVYSGVLASNSPWRRLIIPKAAGVATASPLQKNAEVGGLPAKPVPGPSSVAETKPESGGASQGDAFADPGDGSACGAETRAGRA